MIIVMQADASRQQLDRVVGRVESRGLRPHVIVGTERTVVAVVGDERGGATEGMETLPGVAAVLPILAPYKVASREVQAEPTVVRAGSLVVGGISVGVIAGPCSVESREQIVAAARGVKAAGATALRGGAFKPRTSPYSFQGLKEQGLELLAEARAETGLAIVTEVVSPEDVPLVTRYADVLQITALSTGDCRLGDWPRILRRELALGLLLGGLLAIPGYCLALVYAPTPAAALVIPLTVLGVVLMGTLVGSALPLLFRSFGLDPALMSNPFVSAIVDVVGLVLYMGIALIVLGG